MSTDPRPYEAAVRHEIDRKLAEVKARECASNYYDDTDRTQHPGDRVVRCSIRRGHDGDHAEVDDGEILATWPPQRKPPPRTWTLPPEPGPEIIALRDSAGRTWTRLATSNGWLPGDGHTRWATWGRLLTEFGPLTDASGESS